MLSQLSDHGVSLVKNVPLDDEENVLKVCVPFDLLYFITETASSPSFSTKSVARVKKNQRKKRSDVSVPRGTLACAVRRTKSNFVFLTPRVPCNALK